MVVVGAGGAVVAATGVVVATGIGVATGAGGGDGLATVVVAARVVSVVTVITGAGAMIFPTAFFNSGRIDVKTFRESASEFLSVSGNVCDITGGAARAFGIAIAVVVAIVAIGNAGVIATGVSVATLVLGATVVAVTGSVAAAT